MHGGKGRVTLNWKYFDCWRLRNQLVLTLHANELHIDTKT